MSRHSSDVDLELLSTSNFIITNASTGVQTTVDMTEIAALDAIGAADLAKIDGITNGTVVAGKAVVPTTDKHIDALVISDGGFALGAGAGTVVTATAAELNYNDVTTLGTAQASKTVTADANKDVTGFRSIAVDGGVVNSKLGALTVGPVVTSAGVDISANTNRVAGLSVNLANTGATITGLRGCDLRVTDNGGTGAANIVAVQGVATKSSGVGSGELWGGNFIVSDTGGFVENAYGVVGDMTVGASASIGTTGAPHNYVTGGLFNLDIATGATLATENVTAACIGNLVGNNSNGATKVKADAAFAAIINGDSATVTAGAAYKVFRLNSTAACKFDYGVDLYSSEGGGLLDNAFAVSEMRLSSGLNVYSGTAATRAAVRALVGDSAPQGSMFIGTTSVATTKPNLYVKVLAANADTDWERVVTAATD